MLAEPPTVLILGAGINGCALARELLLNGISVCLVDQADISFGATAYSSRLIHGGLRYLEYGEFDLVRESLAERTRLLRLAPQFVRPLQLFIPVDNRFGGISKAAGKFLGWNWLTPSGPEKRRGMWLVRMGLWFYDTYARDPTLPKRRTHSATEPGIVRIDRQKFRWLCSYYDAQVLYPERFTLALLEDARKIAAERGVPFHVYTYHRAQLNRHTVTVSQNYDHGGAATSFEAAVIVNATGAWVDLTLQNLSVPSQPLMGGTKGSHLITYQVRLRDCLAGKAIYAEAADGRPVFVLPFGGGTLIGTTDEPYSGDPSQAVASPAEIDYLLATVNEIVPEARLTREDIQLHYCGVRPLPHVDASKPGAITRRHWLEENRGAPLPFYSIIGGKLTTCRSLAEESAATICRRLGLPHSANSRERLLPGAENYPSNETELAARQATLARQYGLTLDQISAMWQLCGTQVESILVDLGNVSSASLPGTAIPVDFARWVIRQQWVTTLSDLVERRLMLVFAPSLSIACIQALAQLLVTEDKLSSSGVEKQVAETIKRLAAHFGKRLLA